MNKRKSGQERENRAKGSKEKAKKKNKKSDAKSKGEFRQRGTAEENQKPEGGSLG